MPQEKDKGGRPKGSRDKKPRGDKNLIRKEEKKDKPKPKPGEEGSGRA